MKKWGLIFFMGSIGFLESARAQSIGQLIIQLNLDMQKLTSLKNILGDMYQGYRIVEGGYHAISDIAHHGFDLHKAYLDGLLAISPPVQHYSRITDILTMEEMIATECRSANARDHPPAPFTSQELTFIGKVFANLSDDSMKRLDELSLLITPGELRMTDAERLNAIDRIYTETRESLYLLRSFASDISVQSALRSKAGKDIGNLKNLYHLPQTK